MHVSVTNTVPFLKYRQPKAAIVTKMQQIPSRRTANQREMVRKRNQASVKITRIELKFVFLLEYKRNKKLL